MIKEKPKTLRQNEHAAGEAAAAAAGTEMVTVN